MSHTTSKNGIALIKQFEGCILKAYRDSVGVPTIGYGHTSGVRMGQTISLSQANAFLLQDIKKFEAFVNNPEYVPQTNKLNQNQFDALISFAFNLGEGNLKSLCKPGRTLVQIANAMPQYRCAGGVVLSGLVERRAAEVRLFNTPVTSQTPVSTPQATQTTHVQPNYQAGNTYFITCSALKVRTKPALKDGQVVLGKETDKLYRGKDVKNRATTRLGNQIFMYIGLDSKKRERWICADNGTETYVG